MQNHSLCLQNNIFSYKDLKKKIKKTKRQYYFVNYSTMQTHPCNENRVFPLQLFFTRKNLFSLQVFPCKEKLHREKPCFHYREDLQCINELLKNDFVWISKIIVGYEEALWSKKLEISLSSQILTNDRQILVLSQLCNN